jgi:uncharacterized protein
MMDHGAAGREHQKTSHLQVDGLALEELSKAECLRLMATEAVGRICYTRQALPAVEPVNFALYDSAIVIRTNSGSKLAAATRRAVVAFEADDINPATRSGWSVTAVGQAEEITDHRQIARLETLGLESWAAGAQDHFIRIVPKLVTGRRLRPIADPGKHDPSRMRPGTLPPALPPDSGTNSNLAGVDFRLCPSHPRQGHPASWSADVQPLDPIPHSAANSRSSTPGMRTAALASTTPRRVSTAPMSRNMARQRARPARANRIIQPTRAAASGPMPAGVSRIPRNTGPSLVPGARGSAENLLVPCLQDNRLTVPGQNQLPPACCGDQVTTISLTPTAS